MKAAVWHKKGDIRIEDIPLPFPGPRQVKVRMKAFREKRRPVFKGR